MISFVLYTDGEGKNIREWKKKILKNRNKNVGNKIFVGERMREKKLKE